MAPIQTHRAHCGACSKPMVLMHRTGSGIWYYRCQDCGAQTEPRATAAAAAEDVVWVLVTTPHTKSQLAN